MWHCGKQADQTWHERGWTERTLWTEPTSIGCTETGSCYNICHNVGTVVTTNEQFYWNFQQPGITKEWVKSTPTAGLPSDHHTVLPLQSLPWSQPHLVGEVVQSLKWVNFLGVILWNWDSFCSMDMHEQYNHNMNPWTRYRQGQFFLTDMPDEQYIHEVCNTGKSCKLNSLDKATRNNLFIWIS